MQSPSKRRTGLPHGRAPITDPDVLSNPSQSSVTAAATRSNKLSHSPRSVGGIIPSNAPWPRWNLANDVRPAMQIAAGIVVDRRIDNVNGGPGQLILQPQRRADFFANAR